VRDPATALVDVPRGCAVPHAADAPAGLRDVLCGSPRPGRVLAVFPHAVYVTVTEPDVVVALVTADGIRLPNALVLPARAAEAPFLATAVGVPALVGAGAVSVAGTLHVRVGRWSQRRVQLATTDPATLHAGAAAVRRRLEDSPAWDPVAGALADRLGAHVLGDPQVAWAAADAVLGLGGGLTPTGDDVLAGLLSAGTAFGGAVGDHALLRSLRRLAVRVDAHADRRTTRLSAALLRHAARGEMAAPAAALARVLAAGRDPDAALTALLRVGHRSGADLALGITTAAATVSRHPSDTGAPRRYV
jgi:hypothetical protein